MFCQKVCKVKFNTNIYQKIDFIANIKNMNFFYFKIHNRKS